ncbi:MAG: CotH kinase family protein [Muribaculaceae bacterium]|nr:CotH kinase family protein [Muribaculaceae bacterium]
MKSLFRFLALVALSLPLLSKGQLNVSIYRNDALFNNFRMYEGDSIAHSVETDSTYMVINDFIAGQTKVPLSAIDSLVIHATDIPVLRIAFPDYPEATSLWEKELYLDAVLSIEGNGYTEDMDSLSLQIKGRGNSTWGMPKKPMRLKFPKKISICGFKKAKSYVLLNNYIDPSMMKNPLAMWLAKRLGVPYANTMVPCHVFINGSYAGAYTLTEKVGINSGSVDIDEERGMLFEISAEFDEKYKFRSNIWELPVMVKDPDFDELYDDNPESPSPDERLKLWEDDFNRAEQLVEDGKCADAFDIETAVNYFLMAHFVWCGDVWIPKSVYVHKESLEEEEKYKFGPAWDYDATFNLLKPTEDGFAYNPPDEPFAVPYMFKKIIDSEEFQSRYSERLKEFEEEIVPEFLEFFDEYARLIEPSAKLNGLRWNQEHDLGWTKAVPSFDREKWVRLLREWIIERVQYIKTAPIYGPME